MLKITYRGCDKQSAKKMSMTNWCFCAFSNFVWCFCAFSLYLESISIYKIDVMMRQPELGSNPNFRWQQVILDTPKKQILLLTTNYHHENEQYRVRVLLNTISSTSLEGAVASSLYVQNCRSFRQNFRHNHDQKSLPFVAIQRIMTKIYYIL